MLTHPRYGMGKRLRGGMSINGRCMSSATATSQCRTALCSTEPRITCTCTRPHSVRRGCTSDFARRCAACRYGTGRR
ncbi:hypothetical protein KCP78_23795 [Salmonella enterica subsp. enterica]|nr:hypothetical protein KCP78_23795 [Salmonella enterica subsp. enterica]